MKEGASKTLLVLFISLTLHVFPGRVSFGQDGFRPVENMEGLIELLNENASHTESIQSEFIQKKQLEFLDETIISRGSFWFMKENKLRWAYREPFEYEIVIHGGSFEIRDGEQVSAFDIDSNPAFAEINKLIIGMVRGDLTSDRFHMEAYENKLQYMVSLQPVEGAMKEVISNMEIYFDKADLGVAEVIMKESEKDYTVITFIDKRINEAIADSVFTGDH